jgi:hypothetical protein
MSAAGSNACISDFRNPAVGFGPQIGFGLEIARLVLDQRVAEDSERSARNI